MWLQFLEDEELKPFCDLLKGILNEIGANCAEDFDYLKKKMRLDLICLELEFWSDDDDSDDFNAHIVQAMDSSLFIV